MSPDEHKGRRRRGSAWTLFWILPLFSAACGDRGPISPADQSESNAVSSDSSELSLQSALVIAVINEDLEAIRKLLDEGAVANDVLQVAVAGGNRDIVKLLLDRGAVPDELTVLLAVAATPRHGEKGRDVVRFLLQRGAKGDWRSLYGAIHLDDIDLVRILLNPDYAAVDINQKDREGFTALDEAIEWERWEIVQLLRELGGKHGNSNTA